MGGPAGGRRTTDRRRAGHGARSAVVQRGQRSHYFLVPGLIVLVMTLIGAMLTALVMAREWERGTLEALFVTPVEAGEILLGKTIPYFVLGMIGLALCVLAAEVLVSRAVARSILVLAGGVDALFAGGTGHRPADFVGDQEPVRGQPDDDAGHVPAGDDALGFLFDLRSMPAPVRVITYVLPARYYVALLQTMFLAGDVWSVIVPNAAVLAGMAAVLIAADPPHRRARNWTEST